MIRANLLAPPAELSNDALNDASPGGSGSVELASAAASGRRKAFGLSGRRQAETCESLRCRGRFVPFPAAKSTLAENASGAKRAASMTSFAKRRAWRGAGMPSAGGAGQETPLGASFRM